MSALAHPLSGPLFPHLRSWVAAESFGVRCILRGTPLGLWGLGILALRESPGGGQQALHPSCSLRLLHGQRGQGVSPGKSPRPWPDPQTLIPTSQGPCVPGRGRRSLHERVGLAGSAVAPASTAWAASMVGPGPASEPQSALGGRSALPTSFPTHVLPAVTLFRGSPTRCGRGEPAPGRDTNKRRLLRSRFRGPGARARQPAQVRVAWALQQGPWDLR